MKKLIYILCLALILMSCSNKNNTDFWHLTIEATEKNPTSSNFEIALQDASITKDKEHRSLRITKYVDNNRITYALNNYGTNSIVITVGVIHDKEVNGELRKYVNLGLTLDERIADGIYFAKSAKLLKHILENPELLEDTVETKYDLEII